MINSQADVSSRLEDRLGETRFGRLNDLTAPQRSRLFKIVLGDKPSALKTLTGLLDRFQALNHLSQRAVIARLLTTVAETLASSEVSRTLEGEPLIPEDLSTLNQAKIFEIILYNLLKRDEGIGSISAKDRLEFLQRLAVFLQRKGADFFATPNELRKIVKEVFSSQLNRTDTPESDLENFYRACRRHSGLTTEGQFYDTSGLIDLPVSEHDFDSRIGFSHNSLREYLVAIFIIDAIEISKSTSWRDILFIQMTDVTFEFIADTMEYKKDLSSIISAEYLKSNDSRIIDFLFSIISDLITKKNEIGMKLLGTPPQFRGVDMSLMNLSQKNLANGVVGNCVLQDTDLSGSDLSGVSFDRSILEKVKIDGALVEAADFSAANVVSILAFDEFDTRTTGILEGTRATQWLYSRGARVAHPETLNPLMGRPWYEAAREVTRTLERRIAGTHQETSLAKGTSTKYRSFANSFVAFLLENGILKKITRSRKSDGWVVKLNHDNYGDIKDFSAHGRISDALKPFFEGRRGL